uniref:ubiquitin carboxyl-terminal hydrolase BAP1-like isoform X2 n=1 Tax=Lonchura striata TaxID=40157 RepID=UPI000B4C4E12|nr:ubiquitin carboxyl-terminal hydrolase BAP1-like isoform X2 [Lonchura striata domestica]
MSRRRRQERRRCRQPLAASRCAPLPGMARHGSARPAALTPGAGSGSRGPALAWGGGSRPAPRRSPRRLRALPAALPSHQTAPGTGGQRLRVPAAAGQGRGAGAGCCEPDKDSRGEEEEEEEKEEEKKYTASGEREREENSSPFPSPTGKTGGNAPAPEHCWIGCLLSGFIHACGSRSVVWQGVPKC